MNAASRGGEVTHEAALAAAEAERDAAVARAEKAERHLDYATAALLAEEINEVPPKPCATFVSREPGTMGASCVHCGFPAAHHRIEPTDYAELMEYGERARAAEARCEHDEHRYKGRFVRGWSEDDGYFYSLSPDDDPGSNRRRTTTPALLPDPDTVPLVPPQ